MRGKGKKGEGGEIMERNNFRWGGKTLLNHFSEKLVGHRKHEILFKRLATLLRFAQLFGVEWTEKWFSECSSRLLYQPSPLTTVASVLLHQQLVPQVRREFRDFVRGSFYNVWSTCNNTCSVYPASVAYRDTFTTYSVKRYMDTSQPVDNVVVPFCYILLVVLYFILL